MQKMQWDKVPDRLDSESLKCLLCHTMAAALQKDGDFISGKAMCCTLMTLALTCEDDSIFEDEETLLKELLAHNRPSTKADLEFLEQHAEYIRECTERMLDQIRHCPDRRQEGKA